MPRFHRRLPAALVALQATQDPREVLPNLDLLPGTLALRNGQ
jgi:hypothetical protein